MPKKRPYQMKKRARSQDETRRRIIEATMQLHEELGPRATTISAIARRAGVQRLTVYNHFADETALFQACTSHWLSLNPPPDPAQWTGIRSGESRARAALMALYGYYRRTARMWTAAWRDEADVAALQAPMAEIRAWLCGIADGLLAGFAAEGRQLVLLGSTIHHALAFSTWASLDGQGLGDEEKVATVMAWIAGAR